MKYIKLYEDYLNTDLNVEYLLKRIPFLKVFKNLSTDKGIKFMKMVTNPGIKVPVGENILNFHNITTVSEFFYNREQIGSDRYIFLFNLRNKYHFSTPPNTYNDINYVIFIKAMDQMEKKLSYTFEKVLKTDTLPIDMINEAINEINRTFFEFEEYTENKLNLNNPL